MPNHLQSLLRAAAAGGVFVICTFAGAHARASSKPADVRRLIAERDFSAANKLIAAELSEVRGAQASEPWQFLRLLSAVEAGDNQEALAFADDLLKGTPLLEEEVRSLRSQVLERLGRATDVLAEDKRLLELGPNTALRLETTIRMGRMRMNAGQTREARNLFASIEKKARGTPGHADVVYELLRAEHKLGSRNACNWARRLYEKNPLYPAVRGWGPDLAANEVDGEKLRCPSSVDDFRARVRVLIFNGEDDRARAEVQSVVQGMAESRDEADEMRAWFLLQAGDPDEAFVLLQKNYPRRKDVNDFLMLYASAAARSGRISAAIGAYDRAAVRAVRTDQARKNSYQAAFLSYQFRDYDAATRRFQEFMRKYPRSGLIRDARWNLAWISYLKGDYDGAARRFREIAAGRQAPALRERTRYWLAMSLLRMDQTKAAQPLLASVAADRSGSYYGALARQRLQTLTGQGGPTLLAAADARGPASIEPITVAGETTESEESLAAETDETPEAEEATTDVVQESGRSEVITDLPSPKAPANAKRFERAKMLMTMGFTERARWELYEIERRTSGRDELRTLLTMYQEAGQFHRSSAIAQLRFGGVRVAQGYEGARDLWESAYPRAYHSEVTSYASENSLPPEFIWGIMRAESHFRRDAISPVGAMGLMQIMPGTGRKLATLKKDSTFEPSALLQPPIAVRYGAFYLNRLARNFDGSIPLTAAAYNAGPHRVHSWLLSFGSLSMDEFIEHIPFLETREYVRRVVANALVYESLYGGRSKLVNLLEPVKVQGRLDGSRKESWD